MATYKWRVPIVQAVQFNGKNHEDVKELIGDTSEGEEFLVGTGVYENPEPVEPPPAEVKAEGEDKPEGEGREWHKDKRSKAKAEPKAEDVEAVETVPPTGVPYDPKAKPAEGPKEVKEPLSVSDGDWVVKQTHNGKIEVNPEGFPDGYEFVSS